MFLLLAPFALFFAATLVLGPAIGPVRVNLHEAWAQRGNLAGSLDASVLFLARVPRTLLAALAGAALALAGAAFQALLRNPLAEPFTLGVSSGGALGAVIAIKLGLDVTVLGLSPVMLFALAGSGATVGLVYALGRTRGVLSTSILLLAGVTVSFCFAALILLVFYFSDWTETHGMLHWMMGGLDVTGYGSLARVAPFALAGMAVLLAAAGDLNQLSLGADLAASRGVRVRAAQRWAYLAASLTTGAVVSLVGPIGFVGLIVPHTVRLLVGPDHRVLLPASLLTGAGFLILCDTVARTILAPAEIPVGVLTAALGGPFFVGLLLRAKRRAGAWE
jgi:iron complex transport system permease protein